MSSEHTSPHAATAASKTLTDGRTSEESKSAAGSALSQANKTTEKSTGDEAAHNASEVLSSDDTGANSKTAAASALSQTPNEKK